MSFGRSALYLALPVGNWKWLQRRLLLADSPVRWYARLPIPCRSHLHESTPSQLSDHLPNVQEPAVRTNRMTPQIRLLTEKTSDAHLAQKFPAFAGDWNLTAGIITARHLAFHMLQVPCHQGDGEQDYQIWGKVANINNIDNQLDANNNGLLIIPISSTCFGRWFRPSSGALDCVHSLWYNAPTTVCCRLVVWKRRLPGNWPTTSCVHYPTSCKHSPVLLKMGEIIARNMSSWLELLINR
jgi:hypothetical protein